MPIVKKKGNAGKKKGKKQTKKKKTQKSNDGGGDTLEEGTIFKDQTTIRSLQFRPAGERLINLLKYNPVDKREIHGAKVTSHILEKLTAQEICDLKDVFEIFDCDSDGFLGLVDLWRVLRSLGFQVSREETAKIIHGIKMEGKRKINLCEFLEVIIDRQGDARDSYGEIMKGFEMLDIDGTGSISMAKLQQVCRQTGIKFTHKELTEMMEEADVNGDGSVDQSEFLKIMMQTNLF